ncbi:ATP-dependent helicase [Rothia sp. HMSC068E02]|jgi:putative DEAH-box helicase|uniref:DEAD/DEAH box helicase n=1 Tax=Rothia sp. HMSC068E02 TaxID=1739423 RepID=UPI0008A537D5|nr:DEAD/DEAH box helicase [Rothia sp. HMSC068E02]OFQ75848.1 ATP-dependent helicase [Rothia sp. HMSC068E02]
MEPMPHSISSQNANQHPEQQPTHQSVHQPEQPQGQSAARPKTLRYRELPASAQQVLASLLPEAERTGTLPEQVTHIHTIAARAASYAPWPQWLHPRVVEAFESLGIAEPYAHQVQAADAAHAGLDAALAASAARYGWQAGRIEAERLEPGRVEAPTPAHAEDAKSTGNGGHVIVATGTASGKTLSYLMPTLDAIYRASCGEPVSSTSAYSGAENLNNRANVLYISPAKALSADQLTALTSYNLPGLHAASYDGDTPTGERRWIREHANFILTTPDMLNYSILSNHRQWSSFLRGLRYVVLDEAHSYRGVFGAHIANLLRRLRRVCALYRTVPVFYGASATSSNPVESFSKLIGVPQQAVTAITESTSARGETTVALWEPEFMPPKAHDQLAKGTRSTQQQAVQSKAEQEAPRRVSPVEQGAQMLTDLVLSRTRSLVFAGSRRSVEILSQKTQRYLDEVEAGLAHRVAAYRAGYTPEERRELERKLRNGELLGLASTSALELGIDISGLDAVLVAGWPGTRASFMQRVGRAGRSGQDALAVLIADDNPLDTYLVHHPEAIFGQEVEATVFDPTNPYVLSPQLCAAAQEAPIRAEELSLFGPHTAALLDRLVQQGYLRRRPDGWYWTHAESAADLVDIRGTGGGPYQLIDAEDGTLVGTMDAAHAMSQGHPGAIYIHQSAQYVVESLSEGERVILLSRVYPDYYTRAVENTEVRILAERARVSYGVPAGITGQDVANTVPDPAPETGEQLAPLTMHRGQVQVTDQVTGYRRFSVYGGEYLGEEAQPMPPEVLMTEAVWFTFEPSYLFGAGVTEEDGPGTLHAAEHAAIGLLPLIATSDRWDLGGLSTLLHVDTGRPTIFVYDAAPGGAGISERGFNAVQQWLSATLEAIESCGCDNGCPSCVHSPKCGNRNEPLSKHGARALLTAMLRSMAEV